VSEDGTQGTLGRARSIRSYDTSVVIELETPLDSGVVAELIEQVARMEGVAFAGLSYAKGPMSIVAGFVPRTGHAVRAQIVAKLKALLLPEFIGAVVSIVTEHSGARTIMVQLLDYPAPGEVGKLHDALRADDRVITLLPGMGQSTLFVLEVSPGVATDELLKQLLADVKVLVTVQSTIQFATTVHAVWF
jgi:hypothetical protein